MYSCQKYLIMKKQITIIFFITLSIATFYSCADNVIDYVATTPNESELALTSTDDEIVLSKVDAEKTTATTFNWNKLSYGINTPITYTVEIDVADGDFSRPSTSQTYAAAKSFTHSELNAIALKLNLPPDILGRLKVRLKMSLNYDTLPVYSNVTMLSVTPYSALKFSMPAELYLQGDAVPSNWTPNVTDIQKMTQIDSHRFGLIVYLTGGKNFSFITSATTWSDPAYRTLDNFPNPVSNGTFEPRGSQTNPPWGGDNIKSPTNSGYFQVIADFLDGTFMITPAQTITPPPNELYLIGDATTLGWAAPNASQKFTKEADGFTFSITIPLKSGVFAFINAPATWSNPAYRAKTASEPSFGGNFIASGSGTVPVDGGYNITAPKPGTYKIIVNFKSGTYVLSVP